MMQDPLVFTDNAAAKVWELIREEGNTNLKLRVYVTGGGCSGFQYGFTFDEVIQPDDTVIAKAVQVKIKEGEDESDEGGEGVGSVQLLVDPLSFQYLVGAEIDYQEDVEGEQFIIRNPNAKTTCGCGSSFTA
ncbi:MAG: iron-sulfur cluster insertion protein ErpA [Gammaproteobacteria bacterium RIFCSPHIGHO2_12_FULL_45_9]|nr:MAG: iron-sulfur cluster insertion protein ErpA [Gammaproteobacteria bacterium RIFCSPHIGHO2_12_FULL_45_9]